MQERAIHLAIQRSDIDLSARTARVGVIGGEVQEMFAIGQEIGPAVRGVLRGVKLSHWHGSSPRSCDSINSRARAGLKKDRAIRAPPRPTYIGPIAEPDTPGTAVIHRLPFPVGT